MQDLRQTKEYAQYMQSIGWSVVRCQISDTRCQIFVKKIPLFGTVAKLQRPLNTITAKQLDSFSKKHKISVLYVERSSNVRSTFEGFSEAKSSFVPAKTIHIDLTKSEKKLLSEMKPKTRYNVGLSQKRNVIIKASHNINTFGGLWGKSARGRGMFLPQIKEISALWRAFGNMAHILLAYSPLPTTHYSQPVAGVLMVRTATSAYYMYAAATAEGKKLFAPTLLAWEAIRLAKKRKCKVFDFEGIYDERYPSTKKWKGFTRLKEGFGGKIVTYPETLVKYYNWFVKILNI